MDYKESLIWGNQFLTQINASLSRSVNETPGLYPPPHSPFWATVYMQRNNAPSKVNTGSTYSPQQEMFHFIFLISKRLTKREKETDKATERKGGREN